MSEVVLFDASRLLSRTERAAPTGVDRVCLAYAEWLMALPGVEMIPVRGKQDQLMVVDQDWFAREMGALRARWSTGGAQNGNSGEALLRALHAPEAARESVMDPPPAAEPAQPHNRQRLWKQMFRSRRTPRLPAARLYFNVGHTGLHTGGVLDSLVQQGVEPIVLLHDLIPVTHPEFCRPGDGPRHRDRVLNALRYASRIIVNSSYTGHELALFAVREGLTAPPVDAVHLGLEPLFVRQDQPPTPRPYFIHVGTIEARKNLAFLLTLWRRLQETMGERTPQLVLIGRYGWENEAVLDHLQRSPALKGIVHQAAHLPDEALARLMSGAQAVLAPSSVEGFDLPAVEAMALGVPLIASDIPAHRELVSQAQLIDPLDGLGWLAALETATLGKPSTPPYSAPTWADHFSQVARRTGLPG